MEPIDLRMASVREARSAERRFCFEVITPQYKRVYQATSEDDMNNGISAINNALQSAVEGRGMRKDWKRRLFCFWQRVLPECRGRFRQAARP